MTNVSALTQTGIAIEPDDGEHSIAQRARDQHGRPLIDADGQPSHERPSSSERAEGRIIAAIHQDGDRLTPEQLDRLIALVTAYKAAALQR